MVAALKASIAIEKAKKSVEAAAAWAAIGAKLISAECGCGRRFTAAQFPATCCGEVVS